MARENHSQKLSSSRAAPQRLTGLIQEGPRGTEVEREVGLTFRWLLMPKRLDQGRQIVTSYRIDSHSHRFTPKVPARVLPTLKCRKASNSSLPAWTQAIGNCKTQLLDHLLEQKPLPPVSPTDGVHDRLFPVQVWNQSVKDPPGSLDVESSDNLTQDGPQAELGLQ